MSAERYRSASQQTVLAAIEALAERPLAGIGIEALAGRLGCSRDQAYRAMQNLALAGWAAPAPGGEWQLTPKATQLSEGVRRAIADLHRAYLGDLT